MSLENLREQLAQSLSNLTSVGLGAIGLGFFTANGRQVGPRVQEHGEMLLLSDAGETWSDLRMDGCVTGVPTASEKARLLSICEMFGVAWDQETSEIKCTVRRSEFADAARRLAAASIAIDSWRVWLHNPSSDRAERSDVVVKRVAKIARAAEWDFVEWMPVRGRMRKVWRARGGLTRRGRQVAFTFLPEDNAETAIEHAMGWIGDTDVPLIFIASAEVVEGLEKEQAIVRRAVIVPKRKSGTPERVVQAAEQIASIAA